MRGTFGVLLNYDDRKRVCIPAMMTKAMGVKPGSTVAIFDGPHDILIFPNRWEWQIRPSRILTVDKYGNIRFAIKDTTGMQHFQA